MGAIFLIPDSPNFGETKNLVKREVIVQNQFDGLSDRLAHEIRERVQPIRYHQRGSEEASRTAWKDDELVRH